MAFSLQAAYVLSVSRHATVETLARVMIGATKYDKLMFRMVEMAFYALFLSMQALGFSPLTAEDAEKRRGKLPCNLCVFLILCVQQPCIRSVPKLRAYGRLTSGTGLRCPLSSCPTNKCQLSKTNDLGLERNFTCEKIQRGRKPMLGRCRGRRKGFRVKGDDLPMLPYEWGPML